MIFLLFIYFVSNAVISRPANDRAICAARVPGRLDEIVRRFINMKYPAILMTCLDLKNPRTHVSIWWEETEGKE